MNEYLQYIENLLMANSFGRKISLRCYGQRKYYDIAVLLITFGVGYYATNSVISSILLGIGTNLLTEIYQRFIAPMNNYTKET